MESKLNDPFVKMGTTILNATYPSTSYINKDIIKLIEPSNSSQYEFKFCKSVFIVFFPIGADESFDSVSLSFISFVN